MFLKIKLISTIKNYNNSNSVKINKSKNNKKSNNQINTFLNKKIKNS
jgi:hypothetical protein